MKTAITHVHTHWDREWYRSFEEFRLRLIEVVDRLVNELENGNLSSFYFDGQTGAIEDFLEIYSEKTEQIKKLIQEKKLFIGPFYCLSDVFLVNAPLLIRNLEFGITKSKELGCEDFIAYLADTFGHSKGIIPILNYFGIDKVVMWRGLPETPSEFFWKNLKAINLQRGYFQNTLSLKNLTAKNKAEILENELDKISENSGDTILLPIGGDHIACPLNLKKQIEEVNKYLKNFKIKSGNIFDYFKEVENNFSETYTDEFLDNSKTFLLKGVYSSRIYLKQENARLQWLLGRIAEPLQAFSHYLGYSKSFQNECDYAFKLLLQNHAHDGIYGCSTDEVHREMMTRFAKVKSIANSIIKTVQRDCSAKKGISIINLSNFAYTGVVKILTTEKIRNAQLLKTKKGFADQKIYDIDDVPITEDIVDINEYLVEVENVAPFSICPLEKCLSKKVSTLKINKNEIENDFISLKINNEKIEIFDKKNNKYYKDFLSLVDCQDVGDSYNFAPLKNDFDQIAKLIKTQIIQKGKIQSILRIFYEIKIGEKKKKHVLKLDVILQNNSEFIDFHLNWINFSKNHRLQLKINLPQKVSTVKSEDTCGVITRHFDADYDMKNFLPAPRGVELKTNSAPFQRFVSTEGVGVLTEGLHEYEVEKSSLKITLLRATGVISNPKNPARGTPAGPPIEVSELQCLGKCKAHFGICFAKNDIDLFKNTESFFNPVLPIFSEIEKTFFKEKRNEQFFIHSIKLNSKCQLVAQGVDFKNDYEIYDIYEK